MPVNSISRRFSTGMVQVLERPGNWSLASICLHEVFIRQAGPPLFAGLQHDGGVVHIEGGVIGGAVGTADGAENCFDFGKGANDSVLLLQELRRLGRWSAGQGSGHEERRAFKKGRHELTADVKSEGQRDHQKDEIQQQGGFAKAQAETQDR